MPAKPSHKKKGQWFGSSAASLETRYYEWFRNAKALYKQVKEDGLIAKMEALRTQSQDNDN